MIFDPDRQYGRIIALSDESLLFILVNSAREILPPGTPFSILRKPGTNQYAWYYGPSEPGELIRREVA